MEAKENILSFNPQKIAIFRALQLGDMLCAIPALRSLKKALPSASVTLIGLPWAQSLVKRFPEYISDFIAFPGYPGLPEQGFYTQKIKIFLDEAQGRRFDLVIQMQGNGSITNPLLQLLGGRHTAGYYNPGNYCPDPDWYWPYPANLHEIEKQLVLMEHLGIASTGAAMEFPILPEEEEAYALLSRKHGLKAKNFICIHPGARDPKRRWPVERFAATADKLATQGFRIVLTGAADEAPITARVRENMQAEAIDLAGQTSLGALACLIRDTRLLFSNDTGVSHIATAMKAPSVVLFLASDPNRWAPLNRKLHEVILPAQAEETEYVLNTIQRNVTSAQAAAAKQQANPLINK